MVGGFVAGRAKGGVGTVNSERARDRSVPEVYLLSASGVTLVCVGVGVWQLCVWDMWVDALLRKEAFVYPGPYFSPLPIPE